MIGGEPARDAPIFNPPSMARVPTVEYSHPAGVIAEFECREAAVAAGVPWPMWIDPSFAPERAKTLAWYRLHNLVERHVQAALAHTPAPQPAPRPVD